MRYGSNEDIAFFSMASTHLPRLDSTYNARVTEDDSFEIRLSGEAEGFDWSMGYTTVEMSSKPVDSTISTLVTCLGVVQAGSRTSKSKNGVRDDRGDTTGIYGSIDYRVTTS